MCFVIPRTIAIIILMVGALAQANASTLKINNEANSAVDSQSFVLTAIHFNKDRFADVLELYHVYEPYLGSQIQVSKLKDICKTITDLYQKKGFSAARCVLPDQTIKNGIVDMYLFEGIVSNVRLAGDIGEHDSQLRPIIKQIPLDRPLEEKQLDQVKKLLAAISGISVDVYTQATDDPQKIELVFAVKKHSYNGEFYINNRGSKVVGPVQAGFSLTGHSLLGENEDIKINFLTTTQTSELNYFDLVTAWPTRTIDDSILFGVSYARSQPGDLLAPLNINTKLAGVDAGWLHSLVSTSNRKMSFASLLEYFKSDSTSNGAVYEYDKLYKLKFVLNSQIQHDNAYSALKLSFVRSLPGLNTTISASSGSQSSGRENFDAFRFDMYYSTSLLSNVLFSLQTQGQYGSNSMPISEYIAFGGEDMGSAYDPAEFFGNHGLGGKARLAYRLADSWISTGSTRLFIQNDAVKVWDEATGVIRSGVSLATGVILRSNSLYIDMQVAKPLTSPVLIEGNNNLRFFFDLRYFF